MSERPDPHPADGVVGQAGKPDDHTAPGAHGDAHDDGHGGTQDEHGHGGETLGPVDVLSWGAAGLGVALGLVVVVVLLAAGS